MMSLKKMTSHALAMWFSGDASAHVPEGLGLNSWSKAHTGAAGLFPTLVGVGACCA